MHHLEKWNYGKKQRRCDSECVYHNVECDQWGGMVCEWITKNTNKKNKNEENKKNEDNRKMGI